MRKRILAAILRTRASFGVVATATAASIVLAACAGAGGASTAASPGATPEGVWSSLNRPRPAPLPGAVRITVSNLLLLHRPWSLQGPVTPAIAMEELVASGLLRRSDVEFVERRRFSLAAERERRGQPAPRGAPSVGVSPGAEFILTGTWAASGPDSAALDLRLTDAETGDVVTAWRTMTPTTADPVSVARSINGGLLRALDEMGRLPAWTDPDPGSAPSAHQPTSITMTAVTSFLEGVAAEDAYRWEEARWAYQAALDIGGRGFFEPDVALARVARIRAGGTLGAGDR